MNRLNLLYLSFALSLVLLLSSCATTPPPVRLPQREPPPSPRIANLHPQVVLVLGSGSARGFAHAGVLKVLKDNHIPIDLIVGTSAGSIVGVLYADNPSANSLQRLLLKTKRDQVIDFSYLNITRGPVSGEVLQKFLVRHLQAKTFDELDIPFVAVATNIKTGKIHVFKSGPIPPAINASSATPLYFTPVKMYGQTYVDGGVVDPIAVDVALKFHPKVIIAVSLNHRFSDEVPTYSPEVFLRSFDLMLSQLNDQCVNKADVIIRPQMEDSPMFEADRARLMQEGEEAAQRALPQIKKILAANKIALAKVEREDRDLDDRDDELENETHT